MPFWSHIFHVELRGFPWSQNEELWWIPAQRSLLLPIKCVPSPGHHYTEHLSHVWFLPCGFSVVSSAILSSARAPHASAVPGERRFANSSWAGSMSYSSACLPQSPAVFFFFYEEVLVNQCTFFYQAVRTMQFNPFSHLLWLPESPELHVRPRWSNEPESRVLKFLVELFLSSHLPHCIVSLLLFRLMIMISLAVCLSCKWSPSLWGRM